MRAGIGQRGMYWRWLCAALLCCTLAPQAITQPEARISTLSPLDNSYLEQQRQLVGDLAARHLGTVISGEREHDITTLQALLDRGLVRADQTRELQAMGVVLGDLLAADLDLDWVVYEDAVGRSRALRYGSTDNFLFPVTMISRRQEAGSDTPVAEIYARARDIMATARTPLPFQ